MLQFYRKYFAIFILLLSSPVLVFSQEGGLQNDLEWPQWRGPNRDGISMDSGLLKSWPPSGPQVLWRKVIGEGFSSISIREGRTYTMFSEGGDEFAASYDAESGEEIWRVRVDAKFVNSWGNGPRATPSVDETRVYFASSRGKIFAIDIRSGEIAWQHDLVRDSGSLAPDLGYSNSPLLIGDLLIITAGGRSGKGILAFQKDTGVIQWSRETSHPGYSSPIVIDAAGERQIIFFAGAEILSLSPENGDMFWRYEWGSQWNENVATPVFIAEKYLFFSSAHPQDKGSVVLSIERNGAAIEAKPLWKTNVMQNHFSSVVLKDGYLYGTDRSILKCVDAATGEEKWRQRGYGEGTLVLAEDQLIVMGTSGQVGLVDATPERYNEKGRFKILSGKCYAPPSIANGKLFLRSHKEIACLDIRDSSGVMNQ